MKCEKSIEKCKNLCCSCFVIIEEELFLKHKDKIKVPFIFKDNFFYTENLKCIFLEDTKCMIYDDRPEFCRKFGSEENIALTCFFQDKDGRIRIRQERRRLERQLTKEFERFKKQ